MDSTPDQIWQAVLNNLQLQLTGATYDTWLKRTSVIEHHDDVFVVGVCNGYAQDWLEHRLESLVQRELTSIIGRSMRVKFVVVESAVLPAPTQMLALAPSPASVSAPSTPPAAGQREFEVPNYDTREAGWFPITRYESMFWAPLLGRVAWRLWEIIRQNDTRREKTEWTPDARWTAPGLAELVPCGKQALVGVTRNNGNGPRRHAGAFERLIEIGVGRVQRQGEEPHIIYVISVRTRLELLRPSLVQQLQDESQVRHDRWLAEHGFDPKHWFIDT